MIIKSYREAVSVALAKLDSIAVDLKTQSPEATRDMLEKSAATSLSSKLVSGQKQFFAKMARLATAPPTGNSAACDPASRA